VVASAMRARIAIRARRMGSPPVVYRTIIRLSFAARCDTRHLNAFYAFRLAKSNL